MKVQFIVAIEGDWFEGDKRVTAAQAERMLREAVRDQFKFLAKRTSIKRAKAEAASNENSQRGSDK